MGNSIVVDTDILIDLLRKKENAVRYFEENENKFEFMTTIINIFELYTGAWKSINKEKGIKNVEDIIERFKILEFNLESAQEAGRQRALLEKKGEALESRDILIAAIALVNNIPLKTNNKKHFEKIEGLRLV